MSTSTGQNEKKLNRLLADWPPGTVAVQSWLETRGIYRQLTDAYVKGGWLKKLGHGAFMRKGDLVQWTGGLYAIQQQLGLSIHTGARTALRIQGFAHFLALGAGEQVTLFGAPHEKLPGWFVKAPWPVHVVYSSTNLFSDNRALGLTESRDEAFPVVVATPERAMLEFIHLIPRHADVDEARLLMEGLTTLRPTVVQALLEDCRSIRVKRFFMWLAEYHQHAWVSRLDLRKVDFGKGKLAFHKGGRFDKKYQITVPDFSDREAAPET